MSDEQRLFSKSENNRRQKLLSIDSQFNKQNISRKSSSSSLSLKSFRNSKIDTFDSKEKSSIQAYHSSSRLSTIETTKSELIQRIFDSFKPKLNLKCSSNNTTNTSLSSINETTIPRQSLNLSNEIYIHFKNENELGLKPHINDLLEKIDCTKQCTCDRIEIHFNNHFLNQELSYKQKQSLLRIVLRRQQIFDCYFSQSTFTPIPNKF